MVCPHGGNRALCSTLELSGLSHGRGESARAGRVYPIDHRNPDWIFGLSRSAKLYVLVRRGLDRRRKFNGYEPKRSAIKPRIRTTNPLTVTFL